jgi:hypothetical protein
MTTAWLRRQWDYWTSEEWWPVLILVAYTLFALGLLFRP